MSKPKYKRILLKISGEALGLNGKGVDFPSVTKMAKDIKVIIDMGVEVAIVCGGGNLFRGAPAADAGMDRSAADYMGMLGTVMNGLALQNGLEALGCPTRVQTGLDINRVAEPFICRKAVRHLEKGRTVIFAAGTGNPFFTTDTAAALRASEINAEAVFKATKVDGIYDADPMKFPDAKRYDTISYHECLNKGLEIMDSAAFSLCQNSEIPIVVFNFSEGENLERVVCGDTSIATVVK
ncbi:MAG: UMP kinase [Lentisphaeria bacterium]|nr:UMP kinase [Lentisphaeria bacterium]